MARPAREFEEVGDQGCCGRKQAPDQIIDRVGALERQRADRDRRHAGDAVVAAERVHVAEQKVDRQAPGDGAERQEVAAKPKRYRAEKRRDQAGENERERKPEPRRGAGGSRQPGRRISADADEGRLSEGGEAGDAGQQHDAQRDQRVDADVVEQRDGELRRPERRRGQGRYHGECREAGRMGAHASISASSSSACGSDSERSSSTGISTLNTTTSLSALFQNDAKLSRMPTRMAPTAVPG